MRVKLFLIFLLNVINLQCKSQEWLRLDTIFHEQWANKEFKNLIATCKKSVEAAEKEFGDTSLIYVVSLKSLCLVYDENSMNKDALECYINSLDFIKKCKECSVSEYESALSNIASNYVELEEYNLAVRYWTQLINYYELTDNLNNQNYYLAKNKLGETYRIMGLYDKSLKWFQEALNIKTQLGNNHVNYGTVLNNFAQLYQDMGIYDKALAYYQEDAKIILNNYGKTDPNYAICLNNLSTFYRAIGDYNLALASILEAIEITKSNYGTSHPDYLIRSFNLASIYQVIGQNDTALKIYEDILSKVESLDLKNNLLYSEILNNIGMIYKNKGEYSLAQSHMEQSLDKVSKKLGKDHPQYGLGLNNIATLYQDIGFFNLALSKFEESKEIFFKITGRNHINYITTLNNLGILNQKVGNYAIALDQKKEALELGEKLLGKKHSQIATIMNNLALLYQTIGQYEKALPLLIEALDVTSKSLGKDHPDYGNRLNNIATLYQNMGQFEKALPLFIEALDVTLKSLGKNHSDYSTTLNNLALLYQIIGQYEKALPLFEESIENTYHQIHQNFTFLAEKEKEQFYKTISYNFNAWQSYFIKYCLEMPEIGANSFDMELANKGMILNAGIQMRNAVLNSGDKKSLALFDAWTGYKNMLAIEYSKPITERRVDLNELEDITKIKEAELVLINNTFSTFKRCAKTNWQDIQKHLSYNDVAIEFSSFRNRNDKGWTDSIYYVALILRSNDSYPQMIKLFEQKQLDSIFIRTGEGESKHINNIYKNKRLYELIWKPIEKYVNKGDQVYFSPSGALHQISIGAIAINDSTYLGDFYNFNQVGSTGVLASENMNIKSFKDIVVFGGIDFDASDEQVAAIAKDIVLDDNIVSRSFYTTDSTRSGKWTYLNGTLEEAQNIDNMAKSKKIQSQLFTGSHAIEERFKSLSGEKSPTVIHIATHGFFFPDPKIDKKKLEMMSFQVDNKFTLADNPMNRSGLLMAGGNRAWIGEDVISDREDGILTAYEVSNMSLFNTELVVLSACETGLGDIKGSEGVYGLQRAFKQAGVRYLMMSLWKVPDNATKEFMTTFYTEYLTNQKPVREAFSDTQNKMKDKYRNEPYKWGGFVLME